MSITITNQPYAGSAAHNPLIYKASTTNQAQPNFKFVADVYINGVNVARLKPFIDYGSVNTCTIDVSNIVNSYVSADAADCVNASAGLTVMLNSKVDLQVKFGEEYGTTPAVYADLTTSTLRYVFNAALNYRQYVERQTILPSIGWGSGCHAITNYAGTRRIIEGQKLVMTAQYMYYVIGSPSSAKYVRIFQYDKDNNLLSTTSLVVNSNEIVYDNYYCNFSVLELFTRVWNCAYFEVSFSQGVLGQLGIDYYDGVLYRVDFEEADCIHDVYRVHWLNRLGGWDSFNFKALSRTSFDVERKTYNTDEPRTTYANHDFRNKHTLIRYDERIELNTGFISEAEAEWIEEIFTSPIVLLEHNGLFYSAMVENNIYERKESRRGDKLINVNLSAKYSQTNFTQHG